MDLDLLFRWIGHSTFGAALVISGFFLHERAYVAGYAAAAAELSTQALIWEQAAGRVAEANEICQTLYQEVNATLGYMTIPGSPRP